jgi:hypothetical protein
MSRKPKGMPAGSVPKRTLKKAPLTRAGIREMALKTQEQITGQPPTAEDERQLDAVLDRKFPGQ